MALTNKLVKQVDLPVWEWMRFLPAAAGASTLAGSALCTVDDGKARYMYYVTTTAAPGTFWRYDTWSDTWQQLASPTTVPATSAALKYSAYSGYRGNILAATSTTATIAGLKGQVLKGYTIRILTGTGAGQERTITAVADSIVQDQGFISTAVSANQSTDALKKWKYNQWCGYQCRLTYFTGQMQVRKILYNDATSLYFSDTNWQQLNSWGNTGWSAMSPYVLPVAQTGYVIESTVITVASWTVTPDATSTFVIMSGGVWLVSSAGTPGWSSMQYYDIAADTWYNKTAIAGNLAAALGTDWQLERTGEIGGTYDSGTATAGSARTLTDSGKTWTVDQWVGYQVRITAGAGAGQKRRVTGNTTQVLTVERNFDVNPGGTSVYSIWGDTDKLYLSGNATSALLQYSVEQDLWNTSAVMDWGTARSGGIVLPSLVAGYPNETEGIAITSIVRTTTGILTVAVNAGGASYAIGDIVHCTTGGTNGRVRVTNHNAGVVTAVELLQSGSGYGAGSSATTKDTGGGDNNLTITLTVGTVGLITTAIAHGLNTGQVITLSGALTDATWNGNFTILGVDSTSATGVLASTLISVANAGSSASPTYTAHSTTLLVDSTKTWTANEHTGRILAIYGVGIAPAIAATIFTRISSNTANAITMLTSASAVNGTSRYAILDPACFGRDEQYRNPSLSNNGYATAGTGTTLTDGIKTWISNQWLNYKVRVIAGTGLGNESAITGNTGTVLTVASWGVATPDTTSKYIIMDTFGISTSGAAGVINDTTKNWPVNYWVNKRVRVNGGLGQGAEAVITASTATQLTAAIGVTPTTTTSYTILNPPASGTNGSLQWIFGGTVTANKGKYLLKARGNSQGFDLYNINKETWDNTIFIGPQTENFVVGSMFAYDASDRLYYTVGIVGRVGYIDIPTLTQNGAGLTPYAHGAALAGNRMEIVTTADGLQYLYIMRHTGSEMWRMLICF